MASHKYFLHCYFYRYLSALLIFLFITTVNAIDLRVKGPPSVVLQVKSGRTTGHHSQLQVSSALGLWCQAVNGKTFEVVPAQEITFRHHSQVHETQMENEGQNATYTKETVVLADAGVWTCEVKTKLGNATGDISVFLRPVVVSNSSLRFDDHDSSNYHFDASGLTMIRGENCRLECPVFGYPKPEIKWKYQDKQIQQSARISIKDGVLTIKNVTDTDDGNYVCTATNSFKHKGQMQQSEVVVERRLRVKSELAWVTPLCIILVIVMLLVATIVLCEFRKKRNERKLILVETAEDD
uniref:Ig-like domain-containing protein n=1 Tax=Ditylenchus dipsaci TaxID=166011 RepID=A0A915DEK1_9BILA